MGRERGEQKKVPFVSGVLACVCVSFVVSLPLPSCFAFAFLSMEMLCEKLLTLKSYFTGSFL